MSEVGVSQLGQRGSCSRYKGHVRFDMTDLVGPCGSRRNGVDSVYSYRTAVRQLTEATKIFLLGI